MQTSKWLRRTRGLLAVASILVLLVAAAVVLGLRSAGVRQSILARVGAAVEERTGIHLQASDFRLRLLRGELEIEGLTLRVEPTAEPFLTLPAGRVDFDWSDLLGERVVLDSVVADAPVVDLGVPLPAAPAETDEDREKVGEDAVVDVLALEIHRGSVASAAAPESLDVWLDSWRIGDLELSGAFIAGAFSLAEITATAEVTSHRRPRLDLGIAGAGSLAADGAVTLESMRVTSEGLELAIEGSGRLDGPLEIDTKLDLDVGRLAPDLSPEGRLAGSVRLTRERGPPGARVELTATDFPAALLGPLLEPLGLDQAEIAGSYLDAESDLKLRGSEGGVPEFSGRTRITWRRGRETLLALSAEALEDAARGMSVELTALPARPGRRQLRGRLLAGDWREPATMELRAVKLDLVVDDLALAARDLGLRADLVERWGLSGSLAANAEADGPLLGPRMTADLVWRDGGTRVLTARARSLGELKLAGEGRSRFDLELDLFPKAAGRRQLEARLSTSDWSDAGAIRVDSSRLVVEVQDTAALLRDVLERWPVTEAWVGPARRFAVGELRMDLQVEGAPTQPNIDLAAWWSPEAGESVDLRATGSLSTAAPYVDGPLSAAVKLSGLDLGRLELADQEGRPLMGRLTGSASLEGGPGAWIGNLTVDSERLGYAEGVELHEIHLAARVRDSRLEIESMAARLGETLGGGRLVARAGLRLETPIREAELQVELQEPVELLRRASADMRLEGGTLTVSPLRLELTSAEDAEAELVVGLSLPLGALATVPELQEVLASLPVEADPGRVKITLEKARLDPLWSALSANQELRLDGEVEGRIEIDPARPAEAVGEILFEGLVLSGPDGSIEAVDSSRLTLGGRKATFEPFRLRAQSGEGRSKRQTGLETGGELALSSSWTLRSPVAELVEGISFETAGAIDASLLNLFLFGGVGSGPLELEASLSGPPDALAGLIRVDGPDATIFYPLPYATRFSSPEIVVQIERGSATIESATARLNRGDVVLSGAATREEGLDLSLTLEDVRFRMDHGLTLLLDADLTLDRPPGALGRIGGSIVVERGSVRRDLQLDRQLLSAIVGGPELESVEPGPFDNMLLDVSVSTLEGVSVKNNLANLRIDWETLQVRGTVANPAVRGRFDVDPGGRVSAYGQTVRIDEGALILSGDPDVEPRLILETTSSLQDPSLNDDERWYSDTAWGDRGGWNTGNFGSGASGGGTEALTAGVATHYTERLATALGGALTGTEISYRSLPLFGESDTQARWTLSQRLSPRVTFISSQDPRKAEGTTNLVEIHGFGFAPGVVAQGFKDDEGNQGGTLQQTRRIGGASLGEDETLLRRVQVEVGGDFSEKQLRRASGFRRGDPVPEGADFDVEVDVYDFLRRNGYPGSRVRARLAEAHRGLVDIVVDVELGPRINVSFEGDLPTGSGRRAIAALYQPDRLAEATSIDEMRRETVKQLRGRGFLDPEVEIRADPKDPGDSDGDRTVSVVSTGGRRIAPEPPIFTGVAPDVAVELVALFVTELERVELAAGTPGADAFLIQAMRRRGFPEAEVAGRRISEDGRSLTVEIESGRRRVFGSISISGMAAEDTARLEEMFAPLVGQPARADQLGQALTVLEGDLQSRGFIDQRVDLELVEAAKANEVAVSFEVDPGASYRIAEARLNGLDSAKPEWANSILGVETGSVLTQAEIGAGRRRLNETRVFRRVSAEIERPEPIDEPGRDPAGPLDATITYDVVEAARYAVSYGGRWDTESGLGGAVYVSDRNFLGRGRTLGVRAIYLGDNDRSLGLYHSWPRVGGTPYQLEIFAEAKSEVDTGILVGGLEAWGQITIPLSPRRQTRFYTLIQDREFEDLDPEAPPLDEDAFDIFFGWQYVFDSRDRALGVTSPRGVFLGLDASAASKDLGSDFSELRVFGQGSLFYPLSREPLHSRADGPLSWAQSVRVAWLEPFGGVVPTVDRLTAGGEFSVRGYRTDSLGPLDPDGDPLGGEVFLILNHEVHLPIWGPLRGVAFFDAGNVWESTSTIDSKLRTSVGLGLRWASPVGPLRLDLAHALDPREGIDPDYKLYFGFGSTF